MKRICTLAILFVALTLSAAHLHFKVTDSAAAPITNCTITIRLLGGGRTNASSLVSDRWITNTTDTSAECYFSNTVAGAYAAVVYATRLGTSFTLNVPSTNGVVEASDCVSATIDPSILSAYTIAQSDRLFILKTNGIAVSLTLSNVTILGDFLGVPMNLTNISNSAGQWAFIAGGTNRVLRIGDATNVVNGLSLAKASNLTDLASAAAAAEALGLGVTDTPTFSGLEASNAVVLWKTTSGTVRGLLTFDIDDLIQDYTGTNDLSIFTNAACVYITGSSQATNNGLKRVSYATESEMGLYGEHFVNGVAEEVTITGCTGLVILGDIWTTEGMVSGDGTNSLSRVGRSEWLQRKVLDDAQATNRFRIAGTNVVLYGAYAGSASGGGGFAIQFVATNGLSSTNVLEYCWDSEFGDGVRWLLGTNVYELWSLPQGNNQLLKRGDWVGLTNGLATVAYVNAATTALTNSRMAAVGGTAVNATFQGSNYVSGAVAYSIASHTTLAAGYNADVDVATNVFVRFSGFSGIATNVGMAKGWPGRLLFALNDGTNDLWWACNDSGIESVAENRLRNLSGQFTVQPPNSISTWLYDGAASRWRMLSTSLGRFDVTEFVGGTPGTPASPFAWLPVVVGGTNCFLPLYK